MITCEHLFPLEKELRENGIRTQGGGTDWYSGEKGKWVYVECFLKELPLRSRLNLPGQVEWNEYFGFSAGQEAGFHCGLCDAAIYGYHPLMKNNKSVAQTIPDFQ